MPSQEVPYFFRGFGGFLLAALVLYVVAQGIPIFKAAIVKTSGSRAFALFLLNLLIVAAGISISVDALNITSGGHGMTPDELQQLSTSAQNLDHWIWILVGIAAGSLLVFLLDIIRAIMVEYNKSKHGEKEPKVETIVSTKRLDSITKEIGEYRKTKTELEDFLNKVENKEPGSPNTKKEQ